MKRKLLYRICFYVLGMLLLALGIILNTKTNLGVSPLISVAFCVSEIWAVNLGNATLVWYMVFVLVEIICHIIMKDYGKITADIVQIPISIGFTGFMNLFSDMIPEFKGNLLIRLVFLFVAIVLTGMGIVFSLNARIIPNPGDGIVQALSDCSRKKISDVKNILDAVCVTITLVLGFAFAGKVIGIGVGTVLAVIFVGRVVAVGNAFFKERIINLSGIDNMR